MAIKFGLVILSAMVLLSGCMASSPSTDEQQQVAEEKPVLDQESKTGPEQAATENPEPDLRSPLLSFESFKEKFHKHYSSAREAIRRQSLFLAECAKVVASRLSYAAGLSPITFGINEMSDWTDEEFKKVYGPAKSNPLTDAEKTMIASGEEPEIFESVKGGGFKSIFGKKKGESSSRTNYHGGSNSGSPVPSPVSSPPRMVSVDLRDSGCFLPVGNQNRCGACYAFTFIAMVEYFWCKAYNERLKFSEQYIIDCSSPWGNAGCEGGNFVDTLSFANAMGLHEERTSPYTNGQAPCFFTQETSPARCRLSHANFRSFSKDDIGYHLGRGFPVAVNVRVGDSFRRYGGGVDDPECYSTSPKHGMLAVGIKSDSRGPYLIVRNSYGPSWGDRGYYRIRANSDCIRVGGIINHAIEDISSLFAAYHYG